MTAIVTDAHYRMSVSLIRDMFDRGVRVVACEKASIESPVGFASRGAAQCVRLPDEEYEAALLALCREVLEIEGEKPVLLPVGAKTLAMVSRSRDAFSAVAGLCAATSSQLALFNDKAAVSALAKKLGVPVPESFERQPEEADEQPEAVVPCEGLTLATSSITFDEPERFYNITVQKLPETCNQEVTFTSSDETIATANQQGKVVAVNGGTAVITAACGDQTATCLVTCDFIAEEEQEQPEELPPALNSTDMTLFYPGEQAPLIVSNIPEGAQVTFTSENASVATVTSSGTITAVGSGTTTVRAEVSGTKLECIVRCKLDSSAESGADVDAEGCTLSHSDVTMAFLGEYFKISLKDADGNRIKGLSWSSGNTGVCTVDADGVVTATGKGTTTVSTTYGGKSFECIIRCNLK